ncbi:hypothetical protein ACFLIM_38935 [Nonomuraea sp. M3C6]|uniref:Uncharacterized protein n=1 Tax=Nonomuraea marmarensis TaxID=3351344 RepID=A0ABW7AQ27_9ACTN
MFRGWGTLRVFAAWDARRRTFTAYAKDVNDTIVWQVGQDDHELPTINDLQHVLDPHRAYLTVEVVAALLGDQEGGPAAPVDGGTACAYCRVGVAQ